MSNYQERPGMNEARVIDPQVHRPEGDGPTRFVLKWVMTQPVQSFQMPDDAVVIDVQAQHGDPTMWTLSSSGAVDVTRTFVARGTGHPVWPGDGVYVGSAHDVDGLGLVFHIFERQSTEEAP